MDLGCTTDDLKTAQRIIDASDATRSTQVPKRKAIVAIPAARTWNEDVKVDLWYVPGGGRSDFSFTFAIVSFR